MCLIRSSSSESDSETEDDGYIADQTEMEILETIRKIRVKDPDIYKADTKFYTDNNNPHDSVPDVAPGMNAKKKNRVESTTKPMYLKDVLVKEALEHAAGKGKGKGGGDDSDSDSGGNHPGEKRMRAQV